MCAMTHCLCAMTHFNGPWLIRVRDMTRSCEIWKTYLRLSLFICLCLCVLVCVSLSVIDDKQPIDQRELSHTQNTYTYTCTCTHTRSHTHIGGLGRMNAACRRVERYWICRGTSFTGSVTKMDAELGKTSTRVHLRIVCTYTAVYIHTNTFGV